MSIRFKFLARRSFLQISVIPGKWFTFWYRFMSFARSTLTLKSVQYKFQLLSSVTSFIPKRAATRLTTSYLQLLVHIVRHLCDRTKPNVINIIFNSCKKTYRTFAFSFSSISTKFHQRCLCATPRLYLRTKGLSIRTKTFYNYLGRWY